MATGPNPSKLSSYLAAAAVLGDRFVFSRSMATLGAPHVRDRVNVQRVLNNFVIASLPCWLLGLWNLGEQIHVAMALTGSTELPGWRAAVFAALGHSHDGASFVANFLHGLDSLIVTLRELCQAGGEHLAKERLVALGEFVSFLIAFFVEVFLESLDEMNGDHIVATGGQYVHYEQRHEGE